MSKAIVTTRDIVIPAGTVFEPLPRAHATATEEREALVGIGRDVTGRLHIQLADVEDSGGLLEWR